MREKGGEMNYTAEEVRDYVDACRLTHNSPVIADMLTDYAGRIEADDAAVATFSRSDVSKWRDDAFENAAQIVDRYAKHFPEVTGAADDIRALITHPPAQAAQVDPATKPHTLSDFVHTPDAERVQIGQQVAARVDEMMAEPAAQGELVDCPECGSRCTYRAISMSDDVIYEYTPAQAAQSVDVEKVREVIAGLRDYDDSAFNVWADKLEAALPESKP